MALTTCRACGAAVPAQSHACPRCGASLGSAFPPAPTGAAESAPPTAPLAYAPLPPRPAPPPERPWWRTVRGWGNAVGWVIVASVLLFIGWGLYQNFAGADERAAERAAAVEVTKEKEHVRRVFVWVQDTLADTLVTGSASRPAPTSAEGKRIWVIGRMLVDRWTWEREILRRHGVAAHNPPAALRTADYQASARAHPEVGRYLEGRAAALAEIDKGSAAWVQGQIATLARETGLSADDIRGLLPPDFEDTLGDQAPHANALVELHRHLVRVDPRVRSAGGDMLTWEREEDANRTTELVTRANAAAVQGMQARDQRILRERAAFSPLLQ